MKKIFSILAVIGISLVLSSIAFAQEPTHGTKTPGIRKRQVNQQRRITQGIFSDELTRGEYRRLEKEQRGINREEREAKADGIVTRGERREIHREQDQASRHIYRAKHNNRDRD